MRLLGVGRSAVRLMRLLFCAALLLWLIKCPLKAYNT